MLWNALDSTSRTFFRWSLARAPVWQILFVLPHPGSILCLLVHYKPARAFLKAYGHWLAMGTVLGPPILHLRKCAPRKSSKYPFQSWVWVDWLLRDFDVIMTLLISFPMNACPDSLLIASVNPFVCTHCSVLLWDWPITILLLAGSTVPLRVWVLQGAATTATVPTTGT